MTSPSDPSAESRRLALLQCVLAPGFAWLAVDSWPGLVAILHAVLAVALVGMGGTTLLMLAKRQ